MRLKIGQVVKIKHPGWKRTITVTITEIWKMAGGPRYVGETKKMFHMFYIEDVVQ